MSAQTPLIGLNIDSPLVTRTAANFLPIDWPPPRDFPIVIDGNGRVISRYGDSSWRLWPWAKKAITLNFGDGPQRAGSSVISSANADLLRRIAAWWLYGPKAPTGPATLKHRFTTLRPLFVLCSIEGIAASELMRFPAVADKIPSVIPASSASQALALLHRLHEYREKLGFTLLDRSGLIRLEASLPDHEKRQTPYIPPRIWAYQVNRLRAFLDDFHTHRQGIEDCFRFCLGAYTKNAGSLAEACRRQIPCSERPFQASTQSSGARSGREFHGRFCETAERFGIDALLQRWLLQPGESLDNEGQGVKLLGTYFSMVGYVGTMYLLNFSMMRIEEGWSLRADCLEVEHDERFGPIYTLKGATTKTVKDDEARWVTSPSAKLAVDAMTCVARLRMVAAEANPDVPTTPEDLRNPYLALRAYEPWGNAQGCDLPLASRPCPMHWANILRIYRNLLDPQELRITDADLQIARLITPTLDAETFAVGRIWPLAWHQLRRTGAVNMQASGLVSDSSIQYQLKHASRAMSLYYGQGYSRVRMNNKAQNEYIRTMYEVLGKQIVRLFTDRFVSPHGELRKGNILKLVDPKDSKKLMAAAKAGKVSWRETLLGGCTKIGPCEYGGIDNVARCGGGDGKPPCADAMFDREKAPAIRQLSKVIACRLVEAPKESPYRESLEAQQRAVENALNVIDP
jgi:hypothetical protein